MVRRIRIARGLKLSRRKSQADTEQLFAGALLLLLGGEFVDDGAVALPSVRPMQEVIESGQLDMRIKPFRVVGSYRLQFLRGGFDLARSTLPHCKFIARQSGFRIQLQRFVQIGLRFVHGSLFEKNGAEIEVGVEVVRALLDRLAEGGYGSVCVAVLVASRAVHGAKAGDGWIEAEGIIEIAARLRELVKVEQ